MSDGLTYVPEPPPLPRETGVPLVTIGRGSKGIVVYVHPQCPSDMAVRIVGRVYRDLCIGHLPDRPLDLEKWRRLAASGQWTPPLHLDDHLPSPTEQGIVTGIETPNGKVPTCPVPQPPSPPESPR